MARGEEGSVDAEDAQRQREIWEEANFRALWDRRGIKPEELVAKKMAE